MPRGIKTITRSSAEAKAWSKTKKELRQCRLTLAAGKPSDALQQVEAGFRFSSEKADSEFSQFHIEPLPFICILTLLLIVRSATQANVQGGASCGILGYCAHKGLRGSRLQLGP